MISTERFEGHASITSTEGTEGNLLIVSVLRSEKICA